MSARFSRRTLLRGASAATAGLALPLLTDIPLARGQAAPKPPKRLIVVFSPNGTIPSAWASTGSGATFKPGTILTPFVTAGHQGDIIVPHNLDEKAAMDSAGDAHGVGIGTLLTGMELLAGGQFLAGCGKPDEFCGSSGWPGGISVDQVIAKRIGASTKFQSLDFAVKRMSGSLWSRMSYSDIGVPVTPMDDPGVAFDRIFGDVGVDPAVIMRRANRRKAVLDAVSARYTALNTKLSGVDKDKVSAHVAALHDIESRLSAIGAPMGGTSACVKPMRPALAASPEVIYNASGMEVLNAANDVDVPQRNQLIRDLTVSALTCDLTRVATLMLAPSRSDIFFNFIGINNSHHELSHDPDSNTASQMKLVQIHTWYATQVAALITALKGVKEGSGTLFDSTVILWCNELGVGNVHSHTQLPLLIASGKGVGYFKTGQAVTMPAGTAHNRLLLSICHAMGLTDLKAAGNAKFCTDGPIKEIML